MTNQQKQIIEKHISIAKTLISIWDPDFPIGENSNTGAKSDLDDLFLIAIPNKVWDQYREKHGIIDMKISPYYNNESLKETA